MDANQWQWRDGVLTCSLLSDWKHGFFTRSHAPKSPTDLHSHFASTGRAYRAKQVHSNALIHASALDIVDLPLLEADGVWATKDLHNHDSRSVWVCTADCVPVLIGDRRSGAVAAVHAGWRGTAAGIVPKAISTLCKEGSELADLQVALGPAISGGVYQVSREVADQVMATINNPVGLTSDQQPEKVKLDLRKVQAQQLKEMGMSSQNIAIAPYCTLQHEEIFFSYRRYFLNNPHPHPRSPQVQWSGIAIS
jgi:hypothetical protein